MQTTVKAVRGALPAESRSRSTTIGLAYFMVAAIMYGASFVAMVVAPSWPIRIGLTLVNGLTIGILFIVGHDACHGSLTPSSMVNGWLGRIAFLPSLHPYSAWEYSHNALHHGWTNLRGKDPVYCPRTLEEFRALSPARQWLERTYRSWGGLLPLYLITIWWTLEMAPSGVHRAHIDKRGSFQFDRAIVVAFPLLQAGVVAMLHPSTGGSYLELVGLVLLSALVPFLIFSWLIGFATFQHHTHPRVLWYGDEEDWNFFRAQVQSTVHVEFPRWIELLLNNIMEHTAHHVDPKVPLYHLTQAQDAIEAAFGTDNVITERFSFRALSATFHKCQLYDFENHRWLTFDGQPATPTRWLPAEVTAVVAQARRRVHGS